MSEHLHSDFLTGFLVELGPAPFMGEVELWESPLPRCRLQPAANRATGTHSSLWHEASRRWLNSSSKASSHLR